MLLKRKRSASELCSSPSSSGSPPTRDSASFTMDVSRALHEAPAALLHSRTFKRFRDCRPSDDEVHQRTLRLLYSAQRHQHASPASPFPAPAAATTPPPPSSGASQQSLHRFWNIASAPSSPGSSSGVDQPLVAPPCSCDDYGSSLAGVGVGGDAMELDGFDLDKTACGACGKHVCFSCSISNLGEEKRCLRCAGRRVWIGGIGWTNVQAGSVP